MKLTPGAKPNFFRPSTMFPAFLLKPVQGTFPFAPGGALRPRGFGFQPHKVYGRIGNLEVRLARTKGDIKRAQRLRYKVFYEEMEAIPDALAILSRRDEDGYDSIFDHLLVVDHGNPAKGRRWGRPKVVGTYRVLRQDIANRNDGFYTQGEYDIAPLLRARPDHNFIELGRSCVLQALPQQAHTRAVMAGRVGLCARAWRQCDDRLRKFPRHRSELARADLELSAPHDTGACGMARARA